MAYCRKCGTEMSEEVRFCPNCGKEKDAAVWPEVMAAEQDVKDNKAFAILAYFGILVLVPIFAAPKSSVYARFHANQGLVLWITSIILNAAGSILGIFGELLGALSILTGAITFAAGIFTLVLAIMGIVNAAKGEMKELPVIGHFKLLK